MFLVVLIVEVGQDPLYVRVRLSFKRVRAKWTTERDSESSVGDSRKPAPAGNAFLTHCAVYLGSHGVGGIKTFHGYLSFVRCGWCPAPQGLVL